MSSLASGALAGTVVVFDLDGTLVDSAPDLIGALNVLLKEEGLPALPLAEARAFIGKGARWMIQRGFQAAGAPPDEPGAQRLLERFIARYRDRIADESLPFPGVVTALERLRTADAKLAVCTNKRTDLSRALLDALDLSPWFDAVIGSDSAPAIKPDPRHLTTAVAAAGGTIERCVMVGDAAPDAGAARAAGAPLILVSFGYTDIPAREFKPDVLIDHFDELAPACVTLLGVS